MPATSSSEIKRPRKGQAIWMIVNGSPALRYFVEFYSEGCRVALDPALTNVYYDDLSYFFKSEESILLNFISGIAENIRSAVDELEEYQQRLSVIQKSKK